MAPILASIWPSRGPKKQARCDNFRGKLEADISPSPKPAEPKLPAEKMVVGGVGRAIVNPPTTACGDERV